MPIKNNLDKKDKADDLLAEARVLEKEQKELKEKEKTEKFLKENKGDKANTLLAEARLWLEEQKKGKTKKERIKETEESKTENLFKNFPKNDPHYDEIMPLTTETNDPTEVEKYLEANKKQLSPEAIAFLEWSIKQKESGKKKREEKEKKEQEKEETKEKSQQTPEAEPKEQSDIVKNQFKKILEDYRNGKGIPSESFLTFMTTPGAGNFLAKTTENPAFQEAFKQPENKKKIQKTIDQFQKFVKQNQEKEKSTPEAVKKVKATLKKVKEFIKKTNNKEKKSIWGTTGELMGVSVFLLIVVFAMLEFKGIKELTGIKLEGGKKKK